MHGKIILIIHVCAMFDDTTIGVLSTIQSTATVSQSVSATSLPTTPDFAFDKGILAIAIVSGDITLILLLFATVSIITGIVLLKVMMR